MKKVIKENKKGITLIALVITIIVLLILAGISIAMLIGDNGILGKSKLAQEEHEKAAIKEELELEIINIELKKIQEGKDFKRNDLQELENIGAIIEDTRNTSNRRI